MTANDIIKIIETHAPIDLAYEWDNPGLLCGFGAKEVKRVFLALDANLNTVYEAIDASADMMITHHPILFKSINKINFDTPEGKMLELLIKHNITLYSAHTNLDMASDGINAVLAERFGLCDVEIIEPSEKYPGCGLGRIGVLPRTETVYSLADAAKDIFSTPCLRIIGDIRKTVRKVAIGSGSCSEIIPAAIAMGADIMITGDMKYHESLDFALAGMTVIDAGHFPTETVCMDIFEEYLKGADVQILRSKSKDVFTFY